MILTSKRAEEKESILKELIIIVLCKYKKIIIRYVIVYCLICFVLLARNKPFNEKFFVVLQQKENLFLNLFYQLLDHDFVPSFVESNQK